MLHRKIKKKHFEFFDIIQTESENEILFSPALKDNMWQSSVKTVKILSTLD